MNNKLNQIANRQLTNSVRDVAFGALMAVVVAFLLLAFTRTGRVVAAPAHHDEPAAYTLADTAAEIEAHTAAACGDLTAPQPAADPTC